MHMYVVRDLSSCTVSILCIWHQLFDKLSVVLLTRRLNAQAWCGLDFRGFLVERIICKHPSRVLSSLNLGLNRIIMRDTEQTNKQSKYTINIQTWWIMKHNTHSNNKQLSGKWTSKQINHLMKYGDIENTRLKDRSKKQTNDPGSIKY